MRLVVTLGLALLLLSLEAVLVRYMGLSVARIDVTVLLVAFLALRANTLEGAVGAYAVGYLLDLMSGQPTGLYTFLGVLLFLFGRLAASLVDVRSAGSFMLFAAAADGLHGVLAIFFTWLTAKTPGAWGALSALPLQVFYTAIAALLLYPVLRKLDPGQERPEIGALR